MTIPSLLIAALVANATAIASSPWGRTLEFGSVSVYSSPPPPSTVQLLDVSTPVTNAESMLTLTLPEPRSALRAARGESGPANVWPTDGAMTVPSNSSNNDAGFEVDNTDYNP